MVISVLGTEIPLFCEVWRWGKGRSHCWPRAVHHKKPLVLEFFNVLVSSPPLFCDWCTCFPPRHYSRLASFSSTCHSVYYIHKITRHNHFSCSLLKIRYRLYFKYRFSFHLCKFSLERFNDCSHNSEQENISLKVKSCLFNLILAVGLLHIAFIMFRYGPWIPDHSIFKM